MKSKFSIKKKQRGEKYKSLFDELDGLICLELLIEPKGILELSRRFNIEPRTTKKHIEKLVYYGFLTIQKEKQNKKLVFLNYTIRKFLINHSLFLESLIKDSTQLKKNKSELDKEMLLRKNQLKKMGEEKFLKEHSKEKCKE
jgi:DNA-binding MarR family transcriptional regulator